MFGKELCQRRWHQEVVIIKMAEPVPVGGEEGGQLHLHLTAQGGPGVVLRTTSLQRVTIVKKLIINCVNIFSVSYGLLWLSSHIKI